MLTKEKKKQLVKDSAEKVKNAKSIIFADYKGISVKDVTNLKKELRQVGAEYVVAKKTLIDIALKEGGIDTSVKGLEGQIAISFSNDDEVSAAKIIDKFSKSSENIRMLGGSLGAVLMSEEEVNALAKIPAKEELLAKLVGSMKSPISGLVNVMSGNLRGLVQVLNAIKEQKT